MGFLIYFYSKYFCLQYQTLQRESKGLSNTDMYFREDFFFQFFHKRSPFFGGAHTFNDTTCPREENHDRILSSHWNPFVWPFIFVLPPVSSSCPIPCAASTFQIDLSFQNLFFLKCCFLFKCVPIFFPFFFPRMSSSFLFKAWDEAY